MDDGIRGKHLLYIFLVVFILRLPAFWTPLLDIDESQFAGFANILINGGTPYIDSFDTKPLGIYYFFAAIFWLFGKNNMIAVHLVTALWVGLTSMFCYRIAGKLYSRRAGLIAALLYAVFTTTYIPKFISTSIVIVMMLPMTISIDAFLSWDKSGKDRYLWLSGLTWGLACLFKYQAGINLIVMIVYLLIVRPLFMGKKTYRENVKGLIIFAFGGSLIGLAFAAYLYNIGAWDAFVFWSIKGSSTYIAAAENTMNFWLRLAIRGGSIVLSSILLWIFAMKRSIHILKTRSGREEWLILLWFALSFIAVATGGRFYGHYFLQLYPALCILAAGGTIGFLEWIRNGELTSAKRWAYGIFVIGITVPAIVFFAARLYADQIYNVVGRYVHDETPSSFRPIADEASSLTNDNDKIFVWGFATPVYTYANRDSASRFLWCDWLTGRIPGTDYFFGRNGETSSYAFENAWDMFFKDMKKNKPTLFIDTSPGNHHGYGSYPISRYPELKSWLENNYTLVKTIAGSNIYRRK